MPKPHIVVKAYIRYTFIFGRGAFSCLPFSQRREGQLSACRRLVFHDSSISFPILPSKSGNSGVIFPCVRANNEISQLSRQLGRPPFTVINVTRSAVKYWLELMRNDWVRLSSISVVSLSSLIVKCLLTGGKMHDSAIGMTD